MQTQRTTTGQTLSITYDAASNTVIFRELDWFAEPLRSGGVPQKSHTARRLGPSLTIVAKRKPRRRSGSKAA